jgi:hypothetical protein
VAVVAEHKDNMPGRLLAWLRKQWAPFAVLVLLLAILTAGVWSASSDSLVTSKESHHLTSWLYLGLTVAFGAGILIAGRELTSRWSGVLVDPAKNRMSLTQLQMFLWTVLFVSSWTTSVFINLSMNNANDNSAIDALGVAVPGEFIVLMGITATGLVGSKLVLNQKAAANGIKVEGGADIAARAAAGGTVANPDPERRVLRAQRPQWRDLFQGDTVRSANELDFGKVQLFYITVTLLIGYGLVVADSFANVSAAGIQTLPVFNQAFLILLGISHAGYLTVKAAQ